MRKKRKRAPSLPQDIIDDVTQEWGNTFAVAEAAMRGIFEHTYIVDEEADIQVEYALKVGVLAGKYEGDSPREFLDQFLTMIWVELLT